MPEKSGRDPSESLAEAIAELRGRPLVVVTGAGISAASGIPVFRGDDLDAVWNRSPMELATREFFERDPVTQWRWYLQRFDSVFEARPNEAHNALVALERWHAGRGGEFLLVTQNIDTLHERAGSRELVKVHGTADRLRCTRAGCRLAAPRGSIASSAISLDRFRESPGDATLPRCPECDALLRAHVLFFDEFYAEHVDYGFDRASDAAGRMAFLLFVGTSFSVGVTDHFTREARRRGIPAYSIDPRPVAERSVTPIAGRSEIVLPDLCRRLGIPGA